MLVATPRPPWKRRKIERFAPTTEAIPVTASRIGPEAASAPPPADPAALYGASLAAFGWKPGDLFTPLRVAVTGTKVSPPLFETMDIRSEVRTAFVPPVRPLPTVRGSGRPSKRAMSTLKGTDPLR